MDYSAWHQPQPQPQPPQNPNPSIDPNHWQPVDYSAVAYHSFNVDPYQFPSIYPPGTYYQPQPQPQSQPQVVAGINPPYVPPNIVAYGEQTFSHGAIAYYPDPAWGTSVSIIGTPNAVGFGMPNPTTQPQRKDAKKKGNKKTKTTTKTKIVQSAWCEVCRVDCNSKDVLDQHNLGKKHKKNLEKLKLAAAVPGPSFIAPPTSTFATSQVVTTTVSSQAIVTAPVAATAPPHAMTVVPPAALGGFPAAAASIPALAPESLPVPAFVPIDKPIIGLQENPDKPQTTSSKKARKKAAARTDNLEAKRRKVLEGGAAATSVRACSICNVVCNSDTVFNYHLAGQKHASMVRKHASRTGLASAM